MAQPNQIVTPKPRRALIKRLRFSLRSLILCVLAGGSVIAVWQQWDPWPVRYVVKPERQNAVFSHLDFTPDSTQIVYSEYDYGATSNYNFHLLDVKTGQRTATLPGLQSAAAFGPVFSNDGRLMLIAYNDAKAARIWNLRDGSLRCELTGSAHRIYWTRFAPDDSRVLTETDLDTLSVWDTQTGRLLHSVDVHPAMNSASYSPDGKFILHHVTDTTPEVLDAGTLQPLFQIKHHQRYVRETWFSHDGKRILAMSKDKTTSVSDARDGTLLASLPRDDEYLQFCGFSPGDRFIYTSCWDELMLYDAATYNLVYTHHAFWRTHIASTSFTRDGRWLLIRGYDGNHHGGPLHDYAKVYRIGDWGEQHLLSNGRGIEFAEYSPDETRIFIGYDREGVEIFDAASFQRLHTIDYPLKARYHDLILSKDADWLLGYDSDGKALTVWHRRRPEWWWGVAWLPGFWATATFFALLVWSFCSDLRALRRKNQTGGVV